MYPAFNPGLLRTAKPKPALQFRLLRLRSPQRRPAGHGLRAIANPLSQLWRVAAARRIVLSAIDFAFQLGNPVAEPFQFAELAFGSAPQSSLGPTGDEQTRAGEQNRPLDPTDRTEADSAAIDRAKKPERTQGPIPFENDFSLTIGIDPLSLKFLSKREEAFGRLKEKYEGTL